VREAIGHSSFDSLMLATHRKTPLYADDLGLRRFALHGGATSFSTASLLVGLAEAGAIDVNKAGESLLRLVQMHYARIPMSLDLVKRVITSIEGNELLDALSANIAPPAFTPQSAGRLGAQALKWVATEALLSRSLGVVTKAVLTAMARHWTKPLCAYALFRGAVEEMSLLPRAIGTVGGACREFAKLDHDLKIGGVN
jgi:hypothetical protein